MESADITNYDVLVEPPLSGCDGGFQLAKHKGHVGNNRLDVFLNMHSSAYEAAFEKGDLAGCDAIVGKIVSTVCYQCVPRGRFLVSSENGHRTQWHAMDEAGAKELLHKVLRPVSAATVLELVSDLDPTPLPPIITSSATQPLAVGNFASLKPSDLPEVGDDTQKRRRRSSLLRRSASESMVGFMLDKKKVNRNDDQFGTYQEEPSWKRQTNLNRMDVILNSDRDALDPNSQSVGNNRLHILLAMQTTTYKSATVDQQESILDEIIQTVNVFWRGRFLVEVEGGEHEELTKDEARNAIGYILDRRTGQVKKNVRRSAPAQFSRALSDFGRLSDGILPNGVDVSGMHSAAVKSLQRKKIRQNNAMNRHSSTSSGPMENKGTSETKYMPFPLGGQTLRKKRESTVLGKLDASVMEQLVADFDEADCNDTVEPLPPSNSNQFGSKFTGRDSFF